MSEKKKFNEVRLIPELICLGLDEMKQILNETVVLKDTAYVESCYTIHSVVFNPRGRFTLASTNIKLRANL